MVSFLSYLHSFRDFLLSQWLWSMTWGMYHAPINIFLMVLLLRFFARMGLTASVFIALFSQGFAVFVYSLTVIIGFVWWGGVQFVPYDCYAVQLSHPLLICMFLALIYASLQTLFFLILNYWYTLDIRMISMIALISNGVSALLVYRFLEFY